MLAHQCTHRWTTDSHHLYLYTSEIVMTIDETTGSLLSGTSFTIIFKRESPDSAIYEYIFLH